MHDGVTHPAIIEAREVIELEQQLRELADQELAAIGRAIMLSPTLDICEAMLRGEQIPLSELDAYWFRKYGRRRDTA